MAIVHLNVLRKKVAGFVPAGVRPAPGYLAGVGLGRVLSQFESARRLDLTRSRARLTSIALRSAIMLRIVFFCDLLKSFDVATARASSSKVSATMSHSVGLFIGSPE